MANENAPALEANAELLGERKRDSDPFITIAIPNYRRRRYLEINLRSVLAQASDDFEILVSDDSSPPPDDSNAVIPAMLDASDKPFRYYAQRSNLGYDRNVRFCLRAARGRYVFLLGNDDALDSEDVIDELRRQVLTLGEPDVCITNFRDFDTGRVTQRVYSTTVLGTGPWAALHYFRSFSFVTGLMLKREAAQRHETDRWDRSIFYQIYLACRIIAAGGRLAGIDAIAFRDHIRIEGQLTPEHYRAKYKGMKWSFEPKHTGLDSVARVVIDAASPYVAADERPTVVRKVYQQIYGIAYPFWLFEYKGLVNWGMAFGVARDMWPARRLAEYRIRLADRLYLWGLYLGATACGLILPAAVFNHFRHALAAFVRKRRQRVLS